jgi:hypothetical protein
MEGGATMSEQQKGTGWRPLRASSLLLWVWREARQSVRDYFRPWSLFEFHYRGARSINIGRAAALLWAWRACRG